MRNGRPLRFLVVTLGGWTMMRMVALWQTDAPPGTALPLPLIGRAVASDLIVRAVIPPPASRSTGLALPAARARAAPTRARRPAGKADPDEAESPVAIAALVAFRPPAVRLGQNVGAITPPLRPTPIAAARSRLAGSSWLIARGGGGGTLLGGQLGGSQAGARLTYALGSGRRIALSARIATPLHGPGREAGLGIDWQPTRAPLHLVVEQRLSLDGGRGGPTVMAVGGVGPVPVAAGFRVEAYGEGGAIARRGGGVEGGIEGFGDGAARLTRPVATIGQLRVDAGAGGWGAIQRGARRLDVGPTLGMVAPIGEGATYRAVRLMVDWRERIAGDARPGSGPALSLGTNF